jgi:UDPglucose--hexose-1-phosphate uridylyltransferase
MSEFRRDPVTGRWVILAPEQTRRSRDFTPTPAPNEDPATCPFCEGREDLAGREILAWRRPGTEANAPGWDVRVVANREPALRVESALGDAIDGLFQRYGTLGAHEVIVESPRHDDTWSTLTPDSLWRVLWAWRERIRDLKRDTRLKSFVVVKNHGRAAGAKLDHAHSQLFAYPFAPPALDLELTSAKRHFVNAERCVFCQLLAREQEMDQRVIAADADTIALAPFAPRMPFETWVLPHAHAAYFEDASDALLLAVVARLHDVVRRLDATLLKPPFNLVLHTAPVSEDAQRSFHWHVEIVPRLGHVTGVEWGTGVYINQVPPEEAAQVLRDARVM